MDARQEDQGTNDGRHDNRQSAEAPAVSRKVAGGIGAGAVATLAMSGVMLGAGRAGLMRKQPPEKITERVLDELHVQRSEPAEDAWSTIAHFGFGMACGGLFGALRGRLLRARPVSEGVLFGTLVWAASYCGWIPALGIMPPPTRDRPGRSITMLAAHVVFGAVLGGLTPRAPAPRHALNVSSGRSRATGAAIPA
jgi:hypothetical protein